MTLVQKYIESRQWAMLDEYLTLMVAVSERDLSASEEVMESIEKRLGAPVYGTLEATVRDGVAVIPVAGPMFRYANLFSRLSGATSYERLATDIGQVMADEDVTHVIYDINSPGGEVDGAGEVADLIASFRGVKPQVGYVSHLGTSAAYWLAAAMDSIYINETAMVGSIGAVLGVSNRKNVKGRERLEFVTSFAPEKRMDPFSDDADEAKSARGKLQSLVDKIGTVFAENVAAFRGMDVEAVMATRGGVFVGTDAVGVGLADGVGTLEQLISAFSKESTTGSIVPVSLAAKRLEHSTEVVSMKTEEHKEKVEAPVIDRDFLASNHPDLVEAIRTEAAGVERARILAIHDLDAHGFDALKREMMDDPKATSGDAAQAVLTAQGEQEKRRARVAQDALEADEKDLDGLQSATLPTEEVEEEDQLAASILGLMPDAVAESA